MHRRPASRGSYSFIIAVGFSIATTLTSATTAAQLSGDPEALIRKGIELRRQGDDLLAEGYFKRAYELARTPRATAQLGLVELALKDYLAADFYLTAAIEQGDAWVRSYEQTLEDSRAAARSHLMRVQLEDAPTGTKVLVEGEPRLTPGSDGGLLLPSGSTTVTFEAAGHPSVTKTLSGPPGSTQVVSVRDSRSLGRTLQPPSQARPPAQTTPAKFSDETQHGTSAAVSPRVLAIGATAAGAVSIAVGIALALDGNSKRNDIEVAAQSGTRKYDPEDGDYRGLQQAGAGLIIGGSAMVAAGAALFVFGGHTHESPPTPMALLFTVAPGGIRISGHFR